MTLELGRAVEVPGQLTTGYSGAAGRHQNDVRPWVATGIVIDIHRGIVAIKSHHEVPMFYYCKEEDVKIIERRKADRRRS